MMTILILMMRMMMMIIIIITKSGNSLEVRKQNICVFEDTLWTSIIMCNVKVMMIIKSIYWSARQQFRDKLEKENKLIHKKRTNKNKDEENYTKKAITAKCITQSLEYYSQFWAEDYKCDWEKWLRFQICLVLYPPRWQHRLTEQNGQH
jgi:hypothetical protein